MIPSSEFIIPLLLVGGTIAILVIGFFIVVILKFSTSHKSVFILTLASLSLIPLYIIVNEYNHSYSSTLFDIAPFFLLFSVFMLCVNHALFERKKRKKNATQRDESAIEKSDI